MRKVIRFTKLRYIMFALSAVVLIGGIGLTSSQGGFNLGIDFQAGLNQRVQIAPVGFSVAYTGDRDASLDIVGQSLRVELRGEGGVESFDFPFAQHQTLRNMTGALETIEGVETELLADGGAASDGIVGGLSYPLALGEEAVSVNVRNIDSEDRLRIENIREALAQVGDPRVQVVGDPVNQEFMIRLEDPSGDQKEQLESQIRSVLEERYGDGTIVVKQSEYVGPRFSKSLAEQSVSLTLLALLLILAYIWFRFKLGYAVAAITALAHDVLIMLGFIGTTQLEVSTTTIAAVLTIIGYSLNDTIVIFDRIRENEGLLQGRDIEDIINTSITQSLSRTLITSLTTLLAVGALYAFGIGVIKDFALNLIVGILVGTYSSVFIASPVLLAWRRGQEKRLMKKKRLSPALAKEEASVGPAGPTAKQAPVSDGGVDLSAVKSEMPEVPVAERKKKGKRQSKKKKK
ncbi:MAG TPA: protein translocase subunit SecF [Sediminispirochaeta sp.]|nr:protein translocase subunit SecF [Sediminispirochaeta sp.]